MSIHRRQLRQASYLPLFNSAMFRYVVSEKHLAFPVPIGGGRMLKFQLAAIGTQPKTRVKKVKSMNTTRNTMEQRQVSLVSEYDGLTNDAPEESSKGGSSCERQQEQGD